MKINEFIKTHKNIIVAVAVALVAVLLVVHTLVANSILSASDSRELQSNSAVNPRHKEIMENGAGALGTEATSSPESTASVSKPAAKQETTAPKPTVPATTKPTQAASTAPTLADIPFATAIVPETPADYSAQWDLGYLIAIDNPDTSYSTGHVSLTDEDRDLLERLCYGEFGSGGFVGASLIAQSVKDAMYYVGFTSVAQVIREYKYTGSTTSGKNQACQQAVKYVFDENHDAVQHRIMYMYNPYMVPSQFHESQKFILSYENVRFFDKW